MIHKAKVAIPPSTFETNDDIEKNLEELELQQIEQLEKWITVNETQAKELNKVSGNIDTENILRFKTISTTGDGKYFFNSLKQSFNSQYQDNQDNIYSEDEMRKTLHN